MCRGSLQLVGCRSPPNDGFNKSNIARVAKSSGKFGEEMGRLRKWFLVLVYALALFPRCSCHSEAHLLFSEQQPPFGHVSSADSHQSATEFQRQLLHPQFIAYACVGIIIATLGVLALWSLSVKFTYTVLHMAVLCATCSIKTKHHHNG